MFKKILSVFVLSALFSVSFAMAKEPKFILLPNTITSYLMSIDASKTIAMENQAIEVVKRTLDINSASPYTAVRIRFIYSDNEPQTLIVYLLSSKYKSVDLVRINLANNFVVESVVKNYHLQPNDLKQSPNYGYQPVCPDNSVQFVIGNNFTDDFSVETEVQKVYQLAKDKGYNPFLMDTSNPKGPQPTVSAYEDWLSCPNVKGFYNESHGFEEGIVLSDDDLLYGNINGDLVNKLNHEVILFDSCVTFRNPLRSSMTDADKGNAQQYVAGKIYLPFGASERTASCFWTQALNQEALNSKMLEECAIDNYLDRYGFGIMGNGDNHLAPAA